MVFLIIFILSLSLSLFSTNLVSTGTRYFTMSVGVVGIKGLLSNLLSKFSTFSRFVLYLSQRPAPSPVNSAMMDIVVLEGGYALTVDLRGVLTLWNMEKRRVSWESPLVDLIASLNPHANLKLDGLFF